MAANNISGKQIAEVLNREAGYVSERTNGKRPLDTDDVDALASLVSGWSGRTLTIELATRARAQISDQSNVTPGPWQSSEGDVRLAATFVDNHDGAMDGEHIE